MIKNFSSFLENYISNNSNDLINIIDDCFLNFCDEYNQDIHVDRGYLINDNWIGSRMLPDILKLAREDKIDIDLKDVYKISIYNKSYREDIDDGSRISELSNVWKEEINDDFIKCIDRIEKLSNNKLKRFFVNKLSPLHWIISFYMIIDN